VNARGQAVEDDEIARWVAAAHTGRLASYMLGQLVDPRPGSVLAEDDDSYPWEKCSSWTRAALVAATDHLVVWANIVAPQQVFDGMEVRNPPRPYYTLGRGALEAAAQAVWVLDQETSCDRVLRHLRLLYHDLRQMALAFDMAGDTRAANARERMRLIEDRINDPERWLVIKKQEPRYSAMVGECAGAIGMTPDELGALWRSASAAAHGKMWFQHVGYNTVVGEEYEPGYFRAYLEPNPAEISRCVTAAARMTLHGVTRFAAASGYDVALVTDAAFTRLKSETPLK
jgi:hypothetical protein